MTSSNSAAGLAVQVDGIRGHPEVPSTLQHSLILCQHGRRIRKPNQEAPSLALGVLLLPLQVRVVTHADVLVA